MSVKEFQPMRICIVGGGGYLGMNLASALQRDGHFIVILDLSFPTFAHIQIDQGKLLKITGSVGNRELLRNALTGCDVCYHIAGYGMSGGASLERDRCFAVNVQGTANVIEECKNLKVSRLIFTSSVAVIFDGKTELHMADEETTPYPTEFMNPYAESKCEAEKMLLAANNPSGGLSTCALRLRGIYGPGELRTVKRCVNLCMCGLVKCTFTKSENTVTQYSGVNNIVQALLLAEKSLRNPESPAAGRKYHIVDGGPPVDPWAFWYPLISALGCSPPNIQIPYGLAYTLAFFFEFLYNQFGIEPLFTRFEAALTAITNTYSIRRAQEDFGYAPENSHDLTETIEGCRREMDSENQGQLNDQRFGSNIFNDHWFWVASFAEAVFSAKGLSKCAFLVVLLYFGGNISKLCWM